MNYNNSEEIWDEMRSLAWEIFGGISYARLEKEYSLHYPCPDESHPGTFILHTRFHEEVENAIETIFICPCNLYRTC